MDREEDNITEAAIDYYENLFSHESLRTNLRFTENILKMITDEDNSLLMNFPSMEEARDVALRLTLLVQEVLIDLMLNFTRTTGTSLALTFIR